MKNYNAELAQLATIFYDVENVKNERSYRRALKTNLAFYELETAYAHLYAETMPRQESLAFLQDCVARADQEEESSRKEFLRVAEGLGITPDDAVALLDMPLVLRPEGRDAFLSFGSIAVCEGLVLCDTCLTEPIVYLPTHVELSQSDNGYLLEAVGDGEAPIAVHFSRVEKRILPIHAACATDHILFSIDTPWELLRQYATGICEHIRAGVANESECALQPIVSYFEDGDEATLPQELCTLAARHGADGIVKKYANNRERLFRELSRQKYEPMWRELFAAFERSQADYPQEWELYATQADFERHKAFVSAQMHARGFEGEYPHFCKRAPFRRLSTFSSFGESFIVGFEKHAVHYVTCRAVYLDQGEKNALGEKYICGTVFCKSEDEQTDLYSCMFDRRGKTHFSEVYSFSYDPADVFARTQLASAAAKSAELRPLTREERGLKQHFSAPPMTYLLMALLLGTLFGVGMTLGFMLIELVFTLLTTWSFAAFCELFVTTPWWLIGVASGTLFAIPMTVIEYLAAKK